MPAELNILKEVSGRLVERGIPFMLSGSMAMMYYATPRMTRDIDIVIELHRESAADFTSLFSEDYYLDLPTIEEAVKLRRMFNLIHLGSGMKIDFIVRKEGEYREEEFKRRQKVSMGDFDTYIVSKEDLILSKLDWARESLSEIQFNDIRNLCLGGYDDDYVGKWAEALNLTTLLAKVLNE